jgi:hypothetical protein
LIQLVENEFDRKNIDSNMKLASLTEGLNTTSDSFKKENKLNKNELNALTRKKLELDLKLTSLELGLNKSNQLIQLDRIQINDLNLKLTNLERGLNESKQSFQSKIEYELNKTNNDFDLKINNLEKGLLKMIKLNENKIDGLAKSATSNENPMINYFNLKICDCPCEFAADNGLVNTSFYKMKCFNEKKIFLKKNYFKCYLEDSCYSGKIHKEEIPFSNINIKNFLNQGFRVVYNKSYTDHVTTNDELYNLKSMCVKDSIICVGGSNGLDTLLLVSCGFCWDVLTVTPQNEPQFRNGLWWYFTPNLSFGFSSSPLIRQNTADHYDCDENYKNCKDSTRLSWNLAGYEGWRLGIYT